MPQNLSVATPKTTSLNRTSSGIPAGGTLRVTELISWLKNCKPESEVFVNYAVKDHILGSKIEVIGTLSLYPLSENSSAVAMPSMVITDKKMDIHGLPDNSLQNKTVTAGETLEFLIKELAVSRQINSRFGMSEVTLVRFLNGTTNPTTEGNLSAQSKLPLLGYVSSVTIVEKLQDGMLSEVILLGINPKVPR